MDYKFGQVMLFASEKPPIQNNIVWAKLDNTGLLTNLFKNQEGIWKELLPVDFNHVYNMNNPHHVTKEQVGLGNVDNTSDLNKPLSHAEQLALELKVDKILGKGLSTNDYTDADRLKLQNIEEGAQKNTVFSVNGKVGIVNLLKEDVGLSHVDNTSDLNKPVSTATQSALDLKINISEKGIANGVATLDSEGKVPLEQMHDSILNPIRYKGLWNPVTNIPELLETPETNGSFYKVSENGNRFGIDWLIGDIIISNGTSWQRLKGNTGGVSSVNGMTGDVIISKTTIGLDNVDNTSDANKPISILQKEALDSKTDVTDFTNHISNSENPHNVTKTQIGLSDVNNTADLDKPISKATQTALDTKVSNGIFREHTLNSENPHGVTKAQVGLGNVNNTSDIDKPISTAVQIALDDKSNSSDLANHISDKTNPHSVTKQQVGLGDVLNKEQLGKTETATDSDRLGGIASTNYYNVDNSNKPDVDWSCNNLNVNSDIIGRNWKLTFDGTTSFLQLGNVNQTLGAISGINDSKLTEFYINAINSHFTGNLGVGITNPLDKLHVFGNGRFNGNVYANSDVIAYSTQSDVFINGAEGASYLYELGDVEVTNPTDGDILRYDGNTDKWQNINKVTISAGRYTGL